MTKSEKLIRNEAEAIECLKSNKPTSDYLMLQESIDMVIQALEKLEDYKNLEEQGRLIKLPCKVGTDIYYILGIPNETPCVIESCVFELSDIQKIGKTLFLTKSEAEAKLKELRGGKNESSN